MGGAWDDLKSKQKQIKDGKMGMDEGNQRRRKGVGSKEKSKRGRTGGWMSKGTLGALRRVNQTDSGDEGKITHY